MIRILVIDDDAIVRGVLKDLLRAEGYEVLEATNGKEGVRLYRESPTDLIITDLFMPEQEGIETIVELRRAYPAVKIVAISGGNKSMSGIDYLRMAEQLGARRTVTKPFDIDDLLRAVREVLEQAEDEAPRN